MFEVTEASSAVKEVFSKLQDDISKKIFLNRLLYCLDGNKTHLFNMLLELGLLRPNLAGQAYATIGDIYPVKLEKELILYGCGGIAPDIYHLMSKMGHTVSCFCDDNVIKQKTTFCDLPVISPQALLSEFRESWVVISTIAYQEKVYDFLTRHNYPKSNILKSHTMVKQYFGLNFLKPLPNEVYIDVGCMDGETLVQFKEWCAGKYKKLYALEPDATNCNDAKNTILKKSIQRVILINKGAWKCNDILSFSATANGSSNLNESGLIKVDVVALDDIVGEEMVTYIKMDIEGAELNALMGAQHVISKNKPRLAICIYHKPEDILEIPLYLLQIVPSYKFYLRHHSQFYTETVLYAVP